MKSKLPRALIKASHYVVIIPLITLMLLELSLQLIAILVDSERGLIFSQGESIRIVALGDSNTYGLFLPREQSYPYQLEDQWNASHSTQLNILNFGYPGANSTQVLRNLSDVMEEFHPSVVLLTIGANDWWTDPNLDSLDQESSVLENYKNLRVYKLYYTLVRAFFNKREMKDDGYFSDFDAYNIDQLLASVRDLEDQSVNAVIDYPGFTFKVRLSRGREKHSMHFLMENYRNNLFQMERTTERNKGKLILLTYASNTAHYGFSNKLIREFAKYGNIPLIDVATEIEAWCSTKPCDDLFFPDGHPTAKGYKIVAQIVAKKLPYQLESLP